MWGTWFLNHRIRSNFGGSWDIKAWSSKGRYHGCLGHLWEILAQASDSYWKIDEHEFSINSSSGGSAISISCCQEWLFGAEEESLSAILLRGQWSSVWYPVQWQQTPEGLGGKDQTSSEIHLHTINPHVFLRMEFAKGQKNKCELTQKHHILQSSIPMSSDVKCQISSRLIASSHFLVRWLSTWAMSLMAFVRRWEMLRRIPCFCGWFESCEAEHGMEVEEVDSPKIQSASLDIDIEGSQDVCRLGNEKQNWAKELVESDNLRSCWNV